MIFSAKSRTCNACLETKDEASFPSGRGYRGGIRPVCKACKHQALREWRAKNPNYVAQWAVKYKIDNPAHVKQVKAAWYLKNRERELERARARNLMYRTTVLRFYSMGSMKCACCSESHVDFLAIDHINGGGSKQGLRGIQIYRWLIRNGFPDGYRVLCHNCNMARGFYGICPHEMEKHDGGN